MSEKLLRLPEVITHTGLKRAAIYSRIADGTFPLPIKIGARAVAWPESEVQAWIAERIIETRSKATGKAPQDGQPS